jgi:ketosteroid isomerase-like protein
MSLEQQPHTPKTANDSIQQCLSRWKQAMERRDAAAAVACYADDATLFTLAPPLQQRIDRRALQEWLDSWHSGPVYEMRAVDMVADENLAYCRSLTHMSGSKHSGERTELWFRATVCLRKINGTWRIAHEHASVPFLMDGSLRAAVGLRPADH